MGCRCWWSHHGRRGSRYLRRWTGHYDHRPNHQDHHPISLALGRKTKIISNIGRRKTMSCEIRLCFYNNLFPSTIGGRYKDPNDKESKVRTRLGSFFRTSNYAGGHDPQNLRGNSTLENNPNAIPDFEFLTKKTKFEMKRRKSEEREFENTLARANFLISSLSFFPSHGICRKCR